MKNFYLGGILLFILCVMVSCGTHSNSTGQSASLKNSGYTKVFGPGGRIEYSSSAQLAERTSVPIKPDSVKEPQIEPCQMKTERPSDFRKNVNEPLFFTPPAKGYARDPESSKVDEPNSYSHWRSGLSIPLSLGSLFFSIIALFIPLTGLGGAGFAISLGGALLLLLVAYFLQNYDQAHSPQLTSLAKIGNALWIIACIFFGLAVLRGLMAL